MAIYHLTTKIHGRADNPKLHALRSLAYRTGTKIFDPISQRTFNSLYKKKEVVATKTLVPPHAKSWSISAFELWSKAEQRENRYDAQIFREIEAALPIEMSLEEWKVILDGFITDELCAEGMCATYAIHFKEGNPHVHIMITMRNLELDDDGDYQFGEKNRAWNGKKYLQQWREAWARHVNEALSSAGHSARISEKAYKDTDPDKKPTLHVGPDYGPNQDKSAAAKRSKRLKRNAKIKKSNQLAAFRKSQIEATKSKVEADVEALNESLLVDIAGISEEINRSSIIELSVEEEKSRTYVFGNLPNADIIYSQMKVLKEGLGRIWNWGVFESALRKTAINGDAFSEFLKKELYYFAYKEPEHLFLFDGLVDPERLYPLVSSVKSKLQFSNHAAVQELDLLRSIVAQRLSSQKPVGQVRPLIEPIQSPIVPDFPVSTSVAISIVEVPTIEVPQSVAATPMDSNHDFEIALSSFGHLVKDIESFVSKIKGVVEACGRKFNSDILASRISRIERDNLSPPSEFDLLNELFTRQIYSVRTDETRIKNALNAIPKPHQLTMLEVVSQFAEVDASTLNRSNLRRGLSQSSVNTYEDQAIYNLRSILSPSQLEDYTSRKNFMAALNQAYTWVNFQDDIRAMAHDEDGWQRSWWKKQVDNSFGERATALMDYLPKWYYKKPPIASIEYPLGFYTGEPKNHFMNEWLLRNPNPKIQPPEDLLTVGGVSIRAQSMSDVENICADKRYTVGDTNAFKNELWKKLGKDSWYSELGIQLKKYDIEIANLLGQDELRENFGTLTPEDLAYQVAVRMGRIKPAHIYGTLDTGLTNESPNPQSVVSQIIQRSHQIRQSPKSGVSSHPYFISDTPSFAKKSDETKP
jgi:hypothetical protein